MPAETQQSRAQAAVEVTLRKRQRDIATVRKRRLKRNKKKKILMRSMTKRERLARLLQHRAQEIQHASDEQSNLLQGLNTMTEQYRQEKRISAYFWRKWKEVNWRMDELSKG